MGIYPFTRARREPQDGRAKFEVRWPIGLPGGNCFSVRKFPRLLKYYATIMYKNSKSKIDSSHVDEENMELILIIVVLFLLFGGGGYWGYSRRR